MSGLVRGLEVTFAYRCLHRVTIFASNSARIYATKQKKADAHRSDRIFFVPLHTVLPQKLHTMIATTDYVQGQFDHFNHTYFDGKLPRVPILLSRSASQMGYLSMHRTRLPNGKWQTDHYRLHISTRHDLPKDELDDIILHEMIHLYIHSNNLKDNAPHGTLFRSKMEELNSRFGRHITVQYKLSEEQHKQLHDPRPRWHVVAVLTTRDGRQGFKVLPRVRESILKYKRAVLADPDMRSIELYMTCNPFFNDYPTSAALRYHFAKAAELPELLADAERLEL